MKRLNNNTKSLFLLWGLILVSCLIIFRRFLIGDEFTVYNDVGADTMQQYLMHYNSIINAFRDGNFSLWDFTNGFGTSLYALNLFHPFLFILYLAGTLFHPSVVPYLMVYLEILQIFLAATVFFFFLGEFPLSRKSRVIAAYVYGFNGYLLVWGQHYQFGLYVILLPLLLLLAEKALKKKKFSFLLTLAVSLSVLSSVYMSYMSLLTLGLYLLVRTIAMNGSIRLRIKLFLKNCGSILLGIGMMMAVFLPSAAYILNISTRLNNQQSFLDRLLENLAPFYSPFYETAFYRLFSSNLNGIYDNFNGYLNYYEAPVLFSGILFVILFFQYLFTIHRQEASLKLKILQYLTVAFSFFIVLTQIGSMIFNAFAYAFSRHTFVLMPFAALMIAFMSDQIFIKKRISFGGLFVSAALLITLYIKNPGTRQCNTLIIVALGFLMICVLVLGWQKKRPLPPVLVSGVLLFLVMVNMSYDSYYDYNYRVTLRKSDDTYFTEMYGPDITQALDYLKETDSSFYRVEKDYYAGSFCMDALGQNYFGISTYNSTTNKNISEFIQKLWPGLQRLSPYMYSYQQTVYETDMASLMNIKYLISHNPSLNASGFTLLKQFGTVYVYENQNTSSIGKFFTNRICADEMPEDTSSIEMGRFLSENLIVDGTGNTDASTAENYTMDTIDYTLKNRLFRDKESVSIPISQKKLKDYERVYLDFTLKLTNYGVITITLNDSSCYYMTGNANEPVQVRLPVPKDCTEMVIKTTTPENLFGSIRNATFYGSNEAAKSSEKAKIDFPMPSKDTLVTGTVETKTDGTLMLTIPYETGWHAYVDGEEVEVLRGDYGFQALNLSAGSHNITFHYEAPGLHVGIIISCVCIGIFLLLFLLLFLHKPFQGFFKRNVGI